jgi:hypothetical protein
MEERTPDEEIREQEELAQVANQTDPTQGFQIHEPTDDELGDDDGYVADDERNPEPHDPEGTVDEPVLAEEEGLEQDEVAQDEIVEGER